MTTPVIPATMLQLRSLAKASGELEISLQEVPVPTLADDEVLVRVEATPINPSDLGLLVGPADLGTLRASGTKDRPVLTAIIPEKLVKTLGSRTDRSMPVGNEGAGTVVQAGASPQAQALLGRTVAVIGGAMYVQYRAVKASDCLLLQPGTTAREGASCFVNPLTSLGMVETMKLEGHTALVHTAAASNLGQMLNRICIKDGIPLVNIVRREEQAALLRGQGAKYVCVTSADSFQSDLTEALKATGATIGFDATGGGRLASQILSAMEAAILAKAPLNEFSRYGSTVHKQVYLYGSLEKTPTELTRNFGLAWGIGGWLLFPFLNRVGPAVAQRLRERVAAELTTTFASHYTQEVSLAGALRPEAIAAYGKAQTGTKYLINPSLVD